MAGSSAIFFFQNHRLPNVRFPSIPLFTFAFARPKTEFNFKHIVSFFSIKRMTKRPSPFEPGICRQSKMHLNNYENDVIALRDVEERTLKKLLEGVKKLQCGFPGNDIRSNPDNGFHQKNGKWLQKRVTDYITVNGKKINENVTVKGRIAISTLESPKRCSFCESATGSVYQCIQCSESYCSACSFVSYESFEDKRICLTCSYLRKSISCLCT